MIVRTPRDNLDHKYHTDIFFISLFFSIDETFFNTHSFSLNIMQCSSRRLLVNIFNTTGEEPELMFIDPCKVNAYDTPLLAAVYASIA